jgi:hypothetical protein
MPRQYTPRVECTCQHCGKQFSIPPCRMATGRKYCSLACRDAARGADASLPGKIARVCEQCGNPFFAKRGQIAKGWGRFCSAACRAQGNKKQMECTCETCGRMFFAHHSNYIRGRAKHCSLACKGAAQSEQQQRAGSTSWRGGRTIHGGYAMVLVGNGKYVREHRLVMERELGRPLRPDEHVHHIKTGDEGKTDNRPENLVVMTPSDHARLHNPPLDRWSKDHDCCVLCGRTDSPNTSHGRCRKCCDRIRHANFRRTGVRTLS